MSEMTKQRVVVYGTGVANLVLWALLLSGCICFLPSCATADKARKQVGQELAEIVKYDDCPTICYALKAYMRQRLGVEVPGDGIRIYKMHNPKPIPKAYE